MIIPGGSTSHIRCSRTGCLEAPDYRVLWRNPKIHAPDRHKVWLSCAAHRDYFQGYLLQRGFPVAIEDMDTAS